MKVAKPSETCMKVYFLWAYDGKRFVGLDDVSLDLNQTLP